MPNKNSRFFVRMLDEFTNGFVYRNFPNIYSDQDESQHQVEVEPGRMLVVGLLEIREDQARQLGLCLKSRQLRIEIYIKESPGAKIVPWFLDPMVSQERVRVEKALAAANRSKTQASQQTKS